MTRNNTLSKTRVAATELPQRLSQSTNMFGETTTKFLSEYVELQSELKNFWYQIILFGDSGTRVRTTFLE